MTRRIFLWNSKFYVSKDSDRRPWPIMSFVRLMWLIIKEFVRACRGILLLVLNVGTQPFINTRIIRQESPLIKRGVNNVHLQRKNPLGTTFISFTHLFVRVLSIIYKYHMTKYLFVESDWVQIVTFCSLILGPVSFRLSDPKIRTESIH